jgi:NitT/TauT family transport system ATP-binding protein
MDRDQPLLKVSGVTLQYKTTSHIVTATYRVGFEMLKGDRFVLLGPSGCGKSTLQKAVGGYIAPTEGEIRLKGKLITKPGPDRMMVFQEFDQLLPWKTVQQNVAFALEAAKRMPKREAADRAAHYVEMVGLSKFSSSYPHMLSGGMKQRVAIARGMAMEPDILLMDEPFAALDAQTRALMQDELASIWQATRTTVLFITHDIDEAVRLGQRIGVMRAGPGSQVKGVVEVALNGARSRTDAVFLTYYRQVHDMIRDEVAAALGRAR